MHNQGSDKRTLRKGVKLKTLFLFLLSLTSVAQAIDYCVVFNSRSSAKLVCSGYEYYVKDSLAVQCLKGSKNASTIAELEFLYQGAEEPTTLDQCFAYIANQPFALDEATEYLFVKVLHHPGNHYYSDVYHNNYVKTIDDGM
jgi:hypothetical protein